MSAFFDEVFAEQQAQQASPHPPRRPGEGLSGSGKRFATLLTLMVGLTAVPTFIMVRAGVEELRSSPAAPVRPILLEVPEKAPPSNKQPLVIEPEQSWSLPVIPPPEPVVPQRQPILERTAVVDTSVRPVAKKQKAPKVQASAPVPSALSASEQPADKPVQRKDKRHHGERPRVERPERPDVARPDVVRPDVVRPDVVRPVRPYRERAERPRS